MNPQLTTIEFGSKNLLLTLGDAKISAFRLSNQRFVFQLSGIQKALGYEGKSDYWLSNILQSISKFSKIASEIVEAYENPIKANFKSFAEHNEPIKVVPVGVFIETCKIIVHAKENGWLGASLIRVSKVAQSILNCSKNQSIDELAAESCGFNTFKEAMKSEFIQYLMNQTNEKSFLWIRTFPDAFFTMLFRIHSADWTDLKTKPEICGRWLVDIIFSRLPSTLMLDLRANPPKRSYRRKQGLPQENSHPELKKIVAEVTILMETAALNWFIFLQLLNRAYQIQDEPLANLKLEARKTPETFSPFSNSLKKFT